MTQSASAKIGRFEVQSRLGGGMQGQVYLGFDPDLERKVALKVVNLKDSDDESFINDVVREARLAAQISHPNVVPIFEANLHKNAPVLVFEYVPGSTLRQYLKLNEVGSEHNAIAMMMDIGAGMQCAHAQGIAHLDLSPNNIMIDSDNKPRIMDFGLARMVTHEYSRDGEFVSGTPRYMSPEHFSSQNLSCATDIFALGLIFYELLTGEYAINAKDVDAMVGAVCKVEVDWSKLHHANVSAEVIAALRDMLHPDPECRIQDAGEFMLTMEEVLEIKRAEERGQLALDFLMRRLQRRPEFPAFSESIIEVNRLTSDDSAADYEKVGAVILRDFSLTNRIMKIANSAAFGGSGDGVKTISQAIARLGLDLVRMIANGLMLFDQAEDSNPKLTDALVCSFVAGLITRHLVSQTSRRLAEEAFICGLFHNLGHHLVMYYLEHEANDIETLIEKGLDVEDAEREILSTTSAALGKAVATSWHFPDTIVRCMSRTPRGPIALVEESEDIVYLNVNFANEVCALIHKDFQKYSARDELHKLIARYDEVFPGDVEDLTTLLAAALDKFSQIAPTLNVDFASSSFCKKMLQIIADAQAGAEDLAQEDSAVSLRKSVV